MPASNATMQPEIDVAAHLKDATAGLLVPMIIAVTGHRNACQADQLTAGVNQFLAEIERRYPSSPLYLMSGLAEGADRIAASAALARGIPLIAVLPMPVTEYERDFRTPESLEEFRGLLEQAQQKIVMTPEMVPGESRTQCYARQGEYLVERCDLLLALWDGENSEKIGGTADIVSLRLKGISRRASRSGSYLGRRSGDVYQIVTERETSDPRPKDAGSLECLSPDGRRRPAPLAEPDAALVAIERFNRDLREYETTSETPLELSGPSSSETWTSRFSAADALAITYQNRTWRALSLILACSSIGLICFQLQSPFPGLARFLFVGYVAWLLAAYGVYGWLKHHQLESRAFDYRALAEGLRIQIVWREAGLNTAVADFYLSRQQDVLRWIRRALLNWEFHGESQHVPEAVTADSLQHALDSWIRGQIRFFSKSALRQHGSHRWSLRVAQALILASFLVGLSQTKLESPQWLTVLASLLPIFAGTLLVFAKTRAWSEQVRQYKNMLSLFETAEDQLQQMIADGNLCAGRDLLIELGREALGENADWLILHRSRPIKTPTSG
ncbi:MAG: hypothetical protein U0872_06175 [Planctomycetaceae bacterium]